MFVCRGEEAIVCGQMQKTEALCDVLDAAVLKLPDWLAHPDLVLSSAPSQDSLSQVLSCTRVHEQLQGADSVVRNLRLHRKKFS